MDMLRRLTDLLLPQLLLDELARLREKGADHLCVVPHGCLHHAPVHLIGRNRVLADGWIVTNVSSLQLLAHARDAKARRPAVVTSFGLGFETERRSAIPGARDEAIAVAAAMNGRVLLDEQATAPAVLEALENSRFVHIATHGINRPLAPCFHGIRVAPTGGDDGTLRAHQLLGRDLRGLELVTLSACETGLGRTDVADTIHGLPAMLFLAGARALVATLWPVRSAPAEHFFSRLYECLGKGESTLDAFRAAQLSTRAEFPRPADWAAFQFSGNWQSA
jgi:CHAT domain-containing protein